MSDSELLDNKPANALESTEDQRQSNARIVELFEQVVDLSPAERAKHLAKECDDARMRERLEALVRADRRNRQEQLSNTENELTVPPELPMEPPSGELLVGTKIGSYVVTKELDRGGMAVVYEAKHADFDGHAVIKMLHMRRQDLPDAGARVKNEANALARIRHPGIVKVQDVGEHTDGRMYIVLELLDGESLESRLSDRRPLPQSTAVLFALQTARALAAVHAHDIIHRDLKPGNLFVVPDEEVLGGERIKILDFGIAKLNVRAEATRTRTGALMGTPPYMAPEQCRGWHDKVDARTDLYALGVILFRMLTGRLPFEKDDVVEYLIAHIQEPVPSVLQHAPNVHPELADVVSRLLAKEPSQRFATADALAAALGAIAVDGVEPPAQVLPPIAPSALPASIDGHETTDPWGASLDDGRPILGRLWNVPRPPTHYLARQDVALLLDKLLASPPDKKLGVHGMGGMGKSVLVAALAQEPIVCRRFRDGVYWLTLGQMPMITDLQARLARALGDDKTEFRDPDDGARRLQTLLADRSALIVLDDVWDIEHVQAFDVLGNRGRMLLTTRNLEILTWLEAEEYTLQALKPDEALSLLASWTGGALSSLPPAASQVAWACGHLPLAVTVIGALLRFRKATWERVLDWLENADLARLKAKVPTYPHPNVLAALEVSVDALAEDDPSVPVRACYHDLAVFPQSQPIPRSALYVLWSRRGLDAADTDVLVGTFVARAMATLTMPTGDLRGEMYESSWSGKPALVLHNVQHSYVVAQNDDLPALHGALVDAYAALCPRGLAHGPTRAQGYFFQRLPYHLAHAGRHAELCRLLGDYHWLYAKSCAANAAELLADFELLSSVSLDPPTQRQLVAIRDALQLSSHVLAKDPRELPSQIIGRLQRFVETFGDKDLLVELLRAADSEASFPWLRPLYANLTPPGTALVCTVTGHENSVTAVAVSARADRVASAATDCTLRMWELPTGRELIRFEGHAHWIVDVALSRDGTRMASGSADRTIKIWDTERGTCLGTLTGHAREVTCVAMSSDGRRLVSGAADGGLMLWELADLDHPIEARSLASLDTRIGALLLTPDDQRAIAGTEDGCLHEWDLTSGEAVHTWSAHDTEVLALAMTRDGERLFSGARDGGIRVWNPATYEVLAKLRGHERAVFSLAPSIDGKRLISASADYNVAMWSLDDPGEPLILGRHAGAVSGLAVTSDGRYAVSGSRDHTLEVWSMSAAGSHQPRIAHSGGVSHIALTADGNHALSAAWDQTAVFWDLHPQPRISATIKRPCEITAVALTADGQRALLASADGSLALWDLARDRLVFDRHCHRNEITAVAMVPGTNRALTASCDRTLRLWDLDTGNTLHTLSGHRAVVQSMAVTADGAYALSGSYDRDLLLWDLKRGVLERTLSGHSSIIQAVVLTPDGRSAVSAGRDRVLRVWDLERGQLLSCLEGHTSVVEALAVTPDGRHVVSGAQDRTVRVWDLQSGGSGMPLYGHTDRVIDVAVSPDGEHAVSASMDSTIRVWSLRDRMSRARFTGQGTMTTCVFHPTDSRRVIAGDASGHIYVVELAGL